MVFPGSSSFYFGKHLGSQESFANLNELVFCRHDCRRFLFVKNPKDLILNCSSKEGYFQKILYVSWKIKFWL